MQPSPRWSVQRIVHTSRSEPCSMEVHGLYLDVRPSVSLSLFSEGSFGR